MAAVRISETQCRKVSLGGLTPAELPTEAVERWKGGACTRQVPFCDVRELARKPGGEEAADTSATGAAGAVLELLDALFVQRGVREDEPGPEPAVRGHGRCDRMFSGWPFCHVENLRSNSGH